MQEIAYSYYNAPIPGGGYVTGFAHHPTEHGILYCRTDIGGTYRYDYRADRWECLATHVGMEDLSETFPIAIATQETHPERLYVVCGDGRAYWNQPPDEPCTDQHHTGRLCISDDYGKSFHYEDIPCYVHGNLNGRGTGKRLAVTRNGDLWYASQRDGLGHRSAADGTWRFMHIGAERYLTFVWASGDGATLVVGTAGISTRTAQTRGRSLYVSYDGGASFAPLAQPDNRGLIQALRGQGRDPRYAGYVAQRYAYDGRYLYVTLASSRSDAYAGWMGYSCDGGSLIGGRVIRYALGGDGRLQDYEDITPPAPETTVLRNDTATAADAAVKCAGMQDSPLRPYGFGGISSCAAQPGLLAVATLCREGGDGLNASTGHEDAGDGRSAPAGDVLYVSHDYGAHWETALYDLAVGGLHFNASYMRPECNGGHSLVHWMTDVAINPTDPDELWFNTGTGVFLSERFTSADRSFSDHCDGIEETVHLNLYSPPSGEVALIDILGDLGGFAFTDLHRPCSNSFADDQGNRYITCINADYPDSDPSYIAVTARGNWKGKTKGGVILTRDQGQRWERLPLPYGLSSRIDALCRQIETPNVNVGWVALGADGQTLVLSIADGVNLWTDSIVVTKDEGRSYAQVQVYAADGRALHQADPADAPSVDASDEEPGGQPRRHKMKVYADRVDADVFYGFGERGQIYISRDGGQRFYEHECAQADWSEVDFGLIDCANQTEIRGSGGCAGEFYLALRSAGLWKMRYDRDADTLSLRRLSTEHDTFYRVGLGVLPGASGAGSAYLGAPKCLYVSAILGGVYAFYRSEDDGASWQRLSDERHRFGEINSIEGDSRVPGRYYIATGSMGVVVGESA